MLNKMTDVASVLIAQQRIFVMLNKMTDVARKSSIIGL